MSIILQNESGKYYIGSTDNIIERIKHHTGGHTPSTNRMGKVTLVFKQEYQTIQEARAIENKLKKLKRHDYIVTIITDGYIKLRA